MKVNMFLPEYMIHFKCINSKCTDTCCSGWDINIDKNTFKKYNESTGTLSLLVKDKIIENKSKHDSFNEGFMILKEKNKCPFLNEKMLCDIHGQLGEESLCITCKSYPRVYNIVDDIYEKSGITSCEEVCKQALLNKSKMQFIEIEDDIDEDSIEIRRIVDSEAYEENYNILEYFWEIRIIIINILQNREFHIEERLSLLEEFFVKIDKYNNENEYDAIEDLIQKYKDENVKLSLNHKINTKETDEFYFNIAEENMVKKIKSNRLREILNKYSLALKNKANISEYIDNSIEIKDSFNENSFVIENYLVNQVFKNLVPFNYAGDMLKSIQGLINEYRIIKAYTLLAASCEDKKVNPNFMVRVIQALSKELEHNKIYKEIIGGL